MQFLDNHSDCLFSMCAVLLTNPFVNFMPKYLSTESLIIGIEILVSGIAILVSIIYIYLSFKKSTYFFISRVSNNLEVWLSSIIMEESVENIVMPKRFYQMIKNSKARQYIIDELIGCKKSFSGAVAENIVILYNHLGLKNDSIKKMKSGKKWHIKAKGIQELYMMDQRDVLTTIYKNTNSNNEFVRMEAQTGIIHLTGFPGLRFLDVISYPLTEWQQLKLLEQLKLSPLAEDLSIKIPHWLLSKNDTVVVFTLKLADEYQQFAVRDKVIACLVHQTATIRSQALKTLIRIADEKTPSILLGYISKEPFANQAYILDALQYLASDKEKDFLLKRLDHPNDLIKLKAAIVLAKCCTDGMEILIAKATAIPEPYHRILLHVQFEIKK